MAIIKESSRRNVPPKSTNIVDTIAENNTSPLIFFDIQNVCTRLSVYLIFYLKHNG